MRKFKEKRGITLIALVITIIVLLILAGVSLSLVMGNDGILGKATSAVDKNEEVTLKENLQLKLTELKMDEYEKDKKYSVSEIMELIEDEGYISIDSNESEFVVEKDGYEFTVKDFVVQEEVRKAGETPEILKQPAFKYDILDEVGFNVKIIYPYYARDKAI